MQATLVAVRHDLCHTGATTCAATFMRRVFYQRENGKFMSTRKKNADLPRQSKQQETKHEDRKEPRIEPRPLDSESKPDSSCPCPCPSMRTLDLTAMLMIGDEHVVINSEEDENVDFMAEFIDP